jgi:hypothetical protein
VQADVKEIVGVLMRVLDGGEVWEDELVDIGFDAEGEMEDVLNEAYVKLGEFAQALDARRVDPDLDQQMRGELQICLNNIVQVWEQQERNPGG